MGKIFCFAMDKHLPHCIHFTRFIVLHYYSHAYVYAYVYAYVCMYIYLVNYQQNSCVLNVFH